jgi:hypothetical protein
VGVSIWYFLHQGPGTFRPLAAKAFEAFMSGQVSLPRDEDGYVRYAEVVVQLQNRRATKVVSARFYRMRTLEDGHVDPDHPFEVMAAAGGAVSGVFAAVYPTPGVVDAEHRFAERRLHNLSRWEPDEVGLSILRELVNRRAMRSLL